MTNSASSSQPCAPIPSFVHEILIRGNPWYRFPIVYITAHSHLDVSRTMSSLGRLTAALGVGHNENTLALANINFDFSLFRYDAPPAFQQLGANLSESRRQQGEAGTPHRTARRLGALFEGILPQSPELVQAYGERVSEIALALNRRPKATGYGGPFAAHAGPDGTALWAAATSGPGAMPIIMLACMLARIWPGPEATSLWVELVDGRREEIEAKCTGNGSHDYILLQAAQQDLTRTQLAEWDASARAWLRTADEVKKVQQTQLMLIIDNVGLPVNNIPSVYRSVLDSSRLALQFMESLLKGVPQRVQSGAILLGLSAWHLYPDMVVHGAVTKEVKQQDPLIPCGAIVTLGLQCDEKVDQGVYWSLPLAHLRYYGDPVQSSRSTGIDGSRVSMDQLVYVAMGSVLWTQRSHDVEPTIQWFCDLLSFFRRQKAKASSYERKTPDSQILHDFLEFPGWLHMLMHAAETFNRLSDRGKEIPAKLIALGHRRFRTFLAEEEAWPSPLFGLTEPSKLFPLLKDDNERIKILRRIASESHSHEKEFIIRYKPDGPREPNYFTEIELSTRVEAPEYEYASAFPCARKPTKRTISGHQIRIRSHRRWIAFGWENPRLSALIGAVLDERLAAFRAVGEECTIEPFIKRNGEHRDTDISRLYLSTWVNSHVHSMKSESQSNDNGDHGPIYLLEAPWEGTGNKPMNLEFVAGDLGTAALFKVKPGASSVSVENKVYLTGFKALLDNDAFDVMRLHDYFASLQALRLSDGILSLKALASAKDIYKHLPEATVALSIAARPLWISLWAYRGPHQKWQQPWKLELNLAGTFACIAMFESGTSDINPASLKQVFAMSSGNSIFVAAPLLCDPGKVLELHTVRRVIGNIGRAGIAMLIPPERPRIRKPETESWQFINHAPFDGKSADSFRSTTLHLSFTQYTLPYDIGSHGAQDTEVYFLESLISVHDRDKWIADLDVLGTLPLLRKVHQLTPCEEHKSMPPAYDAVAIDSWDELLDREPVTAVIRTHQNPMARLATAIISANQRHNTVILPDVVCWPCLTKQDATSGSTYVQ